MSAVVLNDGEWSALQALVSRGAVDHDAEYNGGPCQRHPKAHVDRSYPAKLCRYVCADLGCGHECSSHIDVDPRTGFSVCTEPGCRCLSFVAGEDK